MQIKNNLFFILLNFFSILLLNINVNAEEFNISSPKQLGIILFEKLKLTDKPKKTKTGQYSTSEETLAALSKENPLISSILDLLEFLYFLDLYDYIICDDVFRG